MQNDQPNPPSSPFVSNVHGRDIKQDRVEQKITYRAIANLIIGSLALIGLILPYFILGQHNLAVAYMAYFRLYLPFQIISTILCIALFIINLVHITQHHYKPIKPVLLGLLGIALSLSPYIYSGISNIIALHDPYTATALTSTSNNCPSSQTRSKNPYLTGLEHPDNSMTHLNAWDGICSYLEAYYRTKQLPQTQDDLMPYIQSYETKNGTTHITINGKQPRDANTVNILTERNCNYKAGKDQSAISVWYLDPKHNNELSCETIKTDENTNLYDLQASHSWYSKQFNQKPTDKYKIKN